MSDIWSASSLYVVLFFILLKVGISSPFEALSKCFIESARVKRETRLLCASQIKLRGCAILQSIISDSESFNHLLQLMAGFDLCPVQLEEKKKNTLIFRTTRLCAAKSVMNMSFLFCLKANAFKKAFSLFQGAQRRSLCIYSRQRGCETKLEGIIIPHLTQCHCHFSTAKMNCLQLFSKVKLMSDIL